MAMWSHLYTVAHSTQVRSKLMSWFSRCFRRMMLAWWHNSSLMQICRSAKPCHFLESGRPTPRLARRFCEATRRIYAQEDYRHDHTDLITVHCMPPERDSDVSGIRAPLLLLMQSAMVSNLPSQGCQTSQDSNSCIGSQPTASAGVYTTMTEILCERFTAPTAKPR